MKRLNEICNMHNVVLQDVEQDSLMLLRAFGGFSNELREIDARYKNSLIVSLEKWGFLERADPLASATVSAKGRNAISRGWIYDSQWISK